jgi:hypothetical protein
MPDEMPIEDVQYLLRNSVKDSTVVFVDSAQRDRTHYPTPSEYVVTLDEPVRNVYAVDVLDAAIPNTTFNVDVTNNRLALVVVRTASSQALLEGRAVLASPTPDQLDASDLAALGSQMFTLGFASPLQAWLASMPAGGVYHVAVADAATAARSLAWYRTAPAVPDSGPSGPPGPQYLLAVETRLAGVPMTVSQAPPAPGSAAADATVAFNGTYYTVAGAADFPQTNGAALATLLRAQRLSGLGRPFALEPSPAGAAQLSAYGALQAGTRLFDVVTYQTARMTADQYTAAAAAEPLRLDMTLGKVAIEIGNYVSGSLAPLVAALQSELTAAQLPVAAGSTSSGGIDKQGILRLTTSDASTRLLVDASTSTAATLLGFNLGTSVDGNAAPASTRAMGAVQLGDQTSPLFASVLRGTSQQLDAPGVINLLGVRYLTLRCKEIEDHMGSAGGFGTYASGIGVFKLLSTNLVAQLRLDFSTLSRKPFHPVAKLGRLTLRFELPDGSLFDFKGVDNQLLLVIKYYQPAPGGLDNGVQAFPSTLNPDYDPDFARYLANRGTFAPCLDDPGAADGRPWQCDDDDDGDEEDDEEDEEDRGQQQQQQQHLRRSVLLAERDASSQQPRQPPPLIDLGSLRRFAR